jgi:hypothetical protein
MWEVDIPQIAFSSDIVLNALFAISAMHLLASNPDDQTLVRASRLYLDKAVQKHRFAIDKVDPETAEPLLVSAVLVSDSSKFRSNVGYIATLTLVSSDRSSHLAFCSYEKP